MITKRLSQILMKKSFLLLFTVLLINSSCNKSDENTEIDLPQWLKAKIEQDEDYSIQHPMEMPAWGVWVRTEYNDKFYFEYSNMLSSSMYRPISYNQDTLSTFIGDNSSEYANKKCCSKVVWHGNKIDEEYLTIFH